MKLPVKTVALSIAFAITASLSLFSGFLLLFNPEFILTVSNISYGLINNVFGQLLFGLFSVIASLTSIFLLLTILGVEPNPPRHVTIANESGAVGVSLSAIEEFIKRKGKSVPGIRDLTVKADELNGSLILKTKVVLELQKNIPDFTKAFHDKLRYELEHSLGIQNINDVNVHIKKIYPKESSEPIMMGASTNLLLKEPDKKQEDKDFDDELGFEDDSFREENFTVISKNIKEEDK